MLAEHFLYTACKRYGREIPGFAPETLDAMLNWPWKGNVRELQNCVERAVILSPEQDLIAPEALGFIISNPSTAPAPAAPAAPAAPTLSEPKEEKIKEAESGTFLPSLDELEKSHILRALTLTKGNRTHAAELLKISIRTLRNKLNEYKLTSTEAA